MANCTNHGAARVEILTIVVCVGAEVEHARHAGEGLRPGAISNPAKSGSFVEDGQVGERFWRQRRQDASHVVGKAIQVVLQVLLLQRKELNLAKNIFHHQILALFDGLNR